MIHHALAAIKTVSTPLVAGFGGGLVYVLAAIETVPDPSAMAPDLKTAVYMLAVAVMGAAIKKGIPDKTAVKSLEDRLVEWIERDKAGEDGRTTFRVNLASQLSNLVTNQEVMRANQEEMKAKIDSVAERVVKIESGCLYVKHSIER